MRNGKKNYGKLTENPGMLKKRILTELCRIAFADIGDYAVQEKDENGNTVLICNDITKCDTSVISEISMSKGALRIKLYNKESALVRLGNYLGMWKEKPEEDIEDLDSIKEGIGE